MQRIEADDGVRADAQLGEPRLCRRDFIRFLIDIEVHQDEFGAGGEGAEHMSGGSVVEPVEAAAQGLAVQRDAAGAGLGVGRVPPEGRFHRERIKPLKDVAD